MNINISKRGLITIICSAIIAIIGIILTSVALNKELFDSSIKDMYKHMDENPLASGRIKSSIGMAYIGSIVTLILSIGLLIYSGVLVFLEFKDKEVSTVLMSIAITASVIVFILSVAAIACASNVTNIDWLKDHAKKISLFG